MTDQAQDECVYCRKPITPGMEVKENDYGEFWCSPECEQQDYQARAEAAWERRYGYDLAEGDYNP